MDFSSLPRYVGGPDSDPAPHESPSDRGPLVALAVAVAFPFLTVLVLCALLVVLREVTY